MSLLVRKRAIRSFFLGLTLIFAQSAIAAPNVIEYSYDLAGRIVGVKRQPSPGLVVTSLSPTSGVVGDTVTVLGNNFDPVPANNIVKFNGVSAVVTSSTISVLIVTVPVGATTGQVSVTVAAATVFGAQVFVVTVPGAPSIVSFSPASGVAGTSVTVMGAGFNSGVGATTAKLNATTLSPTGVSTTQFTFSVPTATGSGRIAVTTANGTATSASDFIVPPGALAIADIATIKRLVVDQPAQDVAMPNGNKSALILFDGLVNGYMTIQMSNLATSPTSASIPFTIYKPDRSVLVSGTVVQTNPTIHIPKLPVAGTYSLVLSPGIATFNANMKLESEAEIFVDGASANFATVNPGQSLRFRSTVVAGQNLGFGISALVNLPAIANASTISVFKPDGAPWGSLGCAPVNIGCDLDMPNLVAGAYTFVWLPSPAVVGTSFTATLSADLVVALTLGTPANVVISRLGQNARLTFVGTAGSGTGIELANVDTVPANRPISYSVMRPDGAVVSGGGTSTFTKGGFANLSNPPLSGTYTVLVNPYLGATTSMIVTVDAGPTVVLDGPVVPMATTVAGETARLVFQASAGQRMAVAIQNFTYATGSSSTVTVYKPDGAAFSSGYCSIGSGGTCKVNLPAIVTAGTYSIVIAPPGLTPITGNVQLTSEAAGTLTADVATMIDMTRAGRNARYTFAGTAGTIMGVEIAGVSTSFPGTYVSLLVYNPAGGLVSQGGALVGAYVNLGVLPTTGNYTVVLDPQNGVPATATVTLDSGRTVVIDGATDNFTTTLPGETVRYKFAATAGQRVDIGLGAVAYGPGGSGAMSITISNQAGTAVTGFYGAPTYPGGNSKVSLSPLVATGTYSFMLAIPTNATSSSGTMTISTPATSTLTIGGSAVSFGPTRLGQSVRYSFSGTAAQLLKVNWSAFSFTPTTAIATIYVLKPDGTTLSAVNMPAGTSSLNIATLPSAGTYTVVVDTNYGVTMSGSLAVVTR